MRVVDVRGEAETIAALESATAAASTPETLAAAAELALPAARLLGPNDTGALAASYELVSGAEPGIASPLIHAGIVEYGWPARLRPAYRRVHAAWEMVTADAERLIGDRVDAAGDGRGL